MQLIILFVFCYHLHAQKILVIDVFTLGHLKRFHISQNTSITYKVKGSVYRQTNTLTDMQDSALYFETGELIYLKDIKKIIINRSNFLTRKLSTFFRLAGIGYIAIDAFNNSINNESPIFKEQVLTVGMVLFLIGEVIHIANKKRIKINKNHTLKIFDLSPN